MFSKHNKKGFTLVELLVVISIISLLSSIVYASVSGAKDKARIAAGQGLESSVYHAFGADIVVRYDFNGATIGTDSSGNNNTITCNSVTQNSNDKPGNSGNSAEFNAVSDYCNFNVTTGTAITTPGNVGLANYGSVSFWLKPTVSADDFLMNLTGTNGWVSFCPSGAGGIIAINSGSCSGGVVGTGVIPLNKWAHIIISWDSSATDKTRIYINGKLSNANTSNRPSPNWANGAILFLGGWGGSNNSFRGLMDNFSIYSQSMQTAQVEQLYAEGAAEHGIALGQ